MNLEKLMTILLYVYQAWSNYIILVVCKTNLVVVFQINRPILQLFIRRCCSLVSGKLILVTSARCWLLLNSLLQPLPWFCFFLFLRWAKEGKNNRGMVLTVGTYFSFSANFGVVGVCLNQTNPIITSPVEIRQQPKIFLCRNYSAAKRI